MLLVACAGRIRHFLAQMQQQDPRCSVIGGKELYVGEDMEKV